MERIKEAIPLSTFYTTNDLQLNPDAKEAVLFAILANECIAGGYTSIGGDLKDIPSVTMGKISFPN